MNAIDLTDLSGSRRNQGGYINDVNPSFSSADDHEPRSYDDHEGFGYVYQNDNRTCSKFESSIGLNIYTERGRGRHLLEEDSEDAVPPGAGATTASWSRVSRRRPLGRTSKTSSSRNGQSNFCSKKIGFVMEVTKYKRIKR